MIQIDPSFKNLLSQFIDAVHREYPIRFAYLFGSRARGEENPTSDIDIAVYFAKHYNPSDITFIRGYLIEFGKEFFNNPIDIISLKHADLFLKYTIVKEGIIIKKNTDSTQAEFESLTLREFFDFQYYSDQYNTAMIETIKKQTYFGDANGR